MGNVIGVDQELPVYGAKSSHSARPVKTSVKTFGRKSDYFSTKPNISSQKVNTSANIYKSASKENA